MIDALKPLRLSPTPWLLLLALGLADVRGESLDSRGAQFLGFTRFGAFQKTDGKRPGETVWTSPEIISGIPWDELVVSWDTDAAAGAYLKAEARAIYPGKTTKYYIMGVWSSDTSRFPRESVARQKDADGDVATDTLKLARAAQALQVRLTLGGSGQAQPKLKFLGISVLNSKAAPAPLPPDRAAWGRVIPVPQRSQMNYPDGKVLCSPTTVSMIMSYWSEALDRPEMDHDVPFVVKGVYDSQWKGAGNWPFNMAYAGSYPGMRAYVTRLTDLSEVEDWIADGIPVGLSVSSDRLHHRGERGNGHLIVCVGFTKDGDVVVNDPGSSKIVRRVYPRKDLIYAWAYSKFTVYLVYPEDSEIPRDRFGHWDSWSARQRIVLRHTAE